MLNTKKMVKALPYQVAVGVLSLVVLLGSLSSTVVKAYSNDGDAQVVAESGSVVNIYNEYQGEPQGARLGAVPNCQDAANISGCPSTQSDTFIDGDFEVGDDAWIIDDLSVGGDLSNTGSLTLGGQLLATSTVTLVANTTSTAQTTTTLTTADSGEIISFASVSTTIFILPSTSTSKGTLLKFVVGGAISENLIIRTSDLGDNIEGSLIVAGAVVDCDAEDTITFVADGENIGDYVELLSDGTYWHIVGSNALTSAKLTCSTT